MIRTDAGMPITRFTQLIGMPRRTYTRHRSRMLAGEPAKGPWPAPVVERIEPTVAKLAGEFPAWGHRKRAAYCQSRLDQVVEKMLRRTCRLV